MSIDKTIDTLTSAMADLTAALDAHTAALNNFKSAATPRPATAAPSTSASTTEPAPEARRRGRRSQAEIAADEAAKKAAEAKPNGGGGNGEITEAELREEVGDFLAYGDEKDKKDLAERDKRFNFVTSICDHYDSDGVKDIDSAEWPKVMNWINRYANGDTSIDVKTDSGGPEPTAAPKSRTRTLV